MSYRERLIKLQKSEYSSYRDLLNYKDLFLKIEDEDDVFLGFKNERMLLYSSVEISNDEFVEDFFKNFSMSDNGEMRYQILTKEGLKRLIEKYEDEIIHMMDDKLKAYHEDPELAFSDFYMKRQHWRMDSFPSLKAYKLIEKEDLDKDTDGSIVSIEYMEYQIFNVVHIYNTFDWKNNYLIVSGW